LDIAIRIEKNGVEFYDTLVASTKSEQAKPIFQYMAEQERQHILDFQNLAAELEAVQPVETYTGEHDAYLEAVAETHMFNDYGMGAKLAKEAKGDAEAIRAAMQFEKDSILLFDLLKAMVPEKDKPKVEALIGQEKQHILKLHQLSQALKVP
jgi:rubrerythrin